MGIHFDSGPVAFLARVTCRTCQILRRLGRQLERHQRLKDTTSEEVTTHEKGAEGVPEDGTTTTASMGTVIDNLLADLMIGSLLGADNPTAILTLGPRHRVT